MNDVVQSPITNQRLSAEEGRCRSAVELSVEQSNSKVSTPVVTRKRRKVILPISVMSFMPKTKEHDIGRAFYGRHYSAFVFTRHTIV
jgi:hypothetical protein